MSWILQVIGRADGGPCDVVGFYVADFDSQFAGRGNLICTALKDSARRFESPQEAHAFWTQPGPSGRPLTAFTMEVVPV